METYSSPFITLAEWSNAPDLRSGSFGSVGSNPTRDNLYIALLAQSGERATVNRKVRYREAAGSKPARSVFIYHKSINII